MQLPASNRRRKLYQKNSHKGWEELKANAVGSRNKWEVHTCKERLRRSTTKEKKLSLRLFRGQNR
jgi:hypothetical protein